MMKKIFFLIVATLVYLNVQAQGSGIVTSRSLSITTQKPVSEKQWFLRGGLNIMSFAGDGAEGLGSKAGYNVMYGFQKPMGTMGAYWGMEYGLGSRGFKLDEDRVNQSVIAHNVQISPFTFGWKYGVTDDIKLDAHLGIFAAIDYTGKLTTEYNGDKETYKMGDWEDWRRYDVGLNIGFGVWYDRFNLDFTFQRGFIETMDESESYTNNIMLRLGIAF